MKLSTLMFWCIIGILLCVAGLYNEFTDQSITNWISEIYCCGNNAPQ